MAKTEILPAGESWIIAATHYKDVDQFGSITFYKGAELLATLRDGDFALTCWSFDDRPDALSCVAGMV